MGLDSYWEVDQEVTFDPPLELWGGLFSEHGQGSFRGKVYDSLIFKITGVSLYQEFIDNQTIRYMATKLESTAFERVRRKHQTGGNNITEGEYTDLQRMFVAYARAGAVLRGCW